MFLKVILPKVFLLQQLQCLEEFRLKVELLPMVTTLLQVEFNLEDFPLEVIHQLFLQLVILKLEFNLLVVLLLLLQCLEEFLLEEFLLEVILLQLLQYPKVFLLKVVDLQQVFLLKVVHL